MRRLLAGAVVVVTLLGGAPPAAADAPVQDGWWNAAHRGLQPPSPPDVGAEDLLLQGGPAGPTAYAALRFVVPAGADAGALVLPFAGSSARRADAVTACPTTAEWEPVQNGAIAGAPTWDCLRNARAALTEDGRGLVFTDIASLVREDGTLDVVLLPGTADRVVLAPPGPDALTVSSPPPPAVPGDAAPVAPVQQGAPFDSGTPVLVPPSPPDTGPSFTALPDFSAPALPATAAPALAPPAAPPPAVPAVPLPAARPLAPAALAFDDDTTRLLVALEALLVLAFFGLLGYGPFSRLAAATGQPLPPGASAPRGIGRFARERSGLVPRL